MENYLTREGLKKIKEELEFLKKNKRKEISEQLKKAIAFGDLSENAAYHEAKEAQGFLEGRIQDLESLIRNSKIVEKIKTGWVQIGSVVSVISDDTPEKFQIVGANESDPLEGKISYNSPLGKILIDKPEGAIVELVTPSGKIKYKILKID